MSEERPKIPSLLKREVRQKCKFGCVMCGNPICDVDHIDNYADVQEHDLDNLTLLCTMHHRQKTNKILSPEIVRERTNNIRHMRGGMPDINFPECHLILGNNIIKSIIGNCFEVQGKDFLRINYDNEAEQVVINAAFYNREENIIFSIEDNIYSTSDDSWDVELVGNRIIFREAPNKVLLTITLDGIKNLIIVKGKLYINDMYYLEINDKGIQCHGYTLMDNCQIEVCETGIMIASAAVLDKIGGNVRGGRHKNGYSAYSRIGFEIDFERIEGIFTRFPKGKD